MKLVFTRLARRGLSRLRAFLRQHNPEAARRAAQRLKSSSQALAKHPLLGRPVLAPDDQRCEEIREIAIPFGVGGYLFRYQVLPEEVRILRIWHSREEKTD